MQLTSLVSLLPLASVASLASAAPASLATRQIGGGPNESELGTGWSGTWSDTAILIPNAWTNVRGADCSYTVTFRRDVRDNGKYKLSYWSTFDQDSKYSPRREEKRPSKFGFRGTAGSDGRREYFAVIDDACSTFYGGRRRPEGFAIYFTESAKSRTNYYKDITAS